MQNCWDARVTRLDFRRKIRRAKLEDDDDVDPMSVLDTDSMNFDLSDDENDETTNSTKDAGKQDKLTLDAKDLISQARAEISKEKEREE